MRLKLLHEAVHPMQNVAVDSLRMVGKAIVEYNPEYKVDRPHPPTGVNRQLTKMAAGWLSERGKNIDIPYMINVRSSGIDPIYIAKVQCKPSKWPRIEVYEYDDGGYFLWYGFNFGDDLNGLLKAIDYLYYKAREILAIRQSQGDKAI